jgi:hypothetical protein
MPEAARAGPCSISTTSAVGPIEAQPVVRAGSLAVFELGLGDRGAEVDVPQRRRSD